MFYSKQYASYQYWTNLALITFWLVKKADNTISYDSEKQNSKVVNFLRSSDYWFDSGTT